MSKRFGRNQKRAMRAQIAGRDDIIALKDQSLDRIYKDLKQANEVMERTAQVLGDHFATLPVQTVEVKEMLDRFRVSIFQPNRCSYVNEAVLSALHYIEMEPYQAGVRADELRGTIHMRYESLSGEVGYALSDHAWRQLSEDHLVELLKQQIAPRMATMLIRAHKNRYL